MKTSIAILIITRQTRKMLGEEELFQIETIIYIDNPEHYKTLKIYICTW